MLVITEFGARIFDRQNKFFRFEGAGKVFFTWIGPHSQVVIEDPQVIRDILARKSGHVTKMIPNTLLKLLVTGIVNYDGEKWAKHRRIISPAFHMEKLKVKKKKLFFFFFPPLHGSYYTY